MINSTIYLRQRAVFSVCGSNEIKALHFIVTPSPLFPVISKTSISPSQKCTIHCLVYSSIRTLEMIILRYESQTKYTLFMFTGQQDAALSAQPETQLI